MGEASSVLRGQVYDAQVREELRRIAQDEICPVSRKLVRDCVGCVLSVFPMGCLSPPLGRNLPHSSCVSDGRIAFITGQRDRPQCATRKGLTRREMGIRREPDRLGQSAPGPQTIAVEAASSTGDQEGWT